MTSLMVPADAAVLPVPYLVYRLERSVTRVTLSLPPGYRSGYVRMRALRAAGHAEAANALLKWTILCLLWGRRRAPEVLAVWFGDEIVHYSFVIPAVGRIAAMRRTDIEITSCWTAPEHRNHQLFQSVIRQICAERSNERLGVWMVCREANVPSSTAIQHSGFELVGIAEHARRLFPLLHRYVLRGLARSLPADRSR